MRCPVPGGREDRRERRVQMANLNELAAGAVTGLLRSRALGAGLGFAISGAAFTIGNLLLARELSVVEFGRVTLALAAFTVFISLAPLGVDQLLLRRRIDPSPALLARVALSSVAAAITAAAGVAIFYTMPMIQTVLLAIAIAAGGLAQAAGLGLRMHGWAILSLTVVSVASWSVLVAGVLGLAVLLPTATAPLVVLAVGALGSALVAWTLLATRHRVAPTDQEEVPRGEAMSLFVVSASGVFVIQIERFVIPLVLGLHALATYAVIASVAIFPFRLLRSGTSFAIIPRLRATGDVGARRALLVAEGKALAAMLSVAALVVTLAAPFMVEWLTHGRYQLGTVLVLAGCFNGAVKMFESLPRSAVIACGTSKEIARLGWLSWLSLLGTIVGAWGGSRWGLAGLIFGGALASLVTSLPAARLGRYAVARGYIG